MAGVADALTKNGLDVDDLRGDPPDRDRREECRVYFAVGMLFAGDTPGSPFGEFALASDIKEVTEELAISMRPLFDPQRSFRPFRGSSRPRPSERPSRGSASPGPFGRDDRPTGGQTDPQTLQPGSSGSSSSSGSGGGGS